MLWIAWLLLAAPPSDLAAVGVVTSPRPEKSVAVLRSAGRSRVVGVGDSAFGGRVSAIASGRVTIDFDGQAVELRLPNAEPARAAALRPGSGPPPAGGVTLERTEIERRLSSESARILAETTLTPVQVGSQVTGYTLARIPEGTILSEAGLQVGDVLTHVNDVPIDSLATLIGLYPRLQTETSVRALVLRGGVPVTLSIQLR